MKITILANNDIASNFAINMLIPKLLKHDITIFLSSKVGGNSKKPAQLNALKFFEQDLFNDLISPLLEAKSDDKSYFMSFKQMGEFINKSVQILNNVNSKDELLILNNTAPDLIISIRYGVILKDDVIAIPKFGVINLHSGLLPAYRGVMATFWAMLNGEKVIGTTLHFINDSRIDAGNIIATSKMNVDYEKSYLWHVLHLYIDGCELISTAITSIVNGKKLVTSSQSENGSYYTFPSETDLSSFKEKGRVLFDEKEVVDFIQSNYY